MTIDMALARKVLQTEAAAIQALVDRLPKSNEMWPLDDRAKWLRTLISVFDLVYKMSEQEQTGVAVVLAKREPLPSR